MFQIIPSGPLPSSCAFVIAVIIDCFSRVYNCFIASNWLNVVTDLVGSSYLGFTYSIPRAFLGHLSFFLQMIWWQCTAIQVFISPQMIWSFFFCCHTSQKSNEFEGNAFITALQGGSVGESGREVDLEVPHTDMGRCSRGQPHPFVMLEWRHLIIILTVLLSCSYTSSKACSFPCCVLLRRKKHREFYMILTATAVPWICKILL